MSQLERKLGLFSVVSICLGAALGSGIFVLPGIASSFTGGSIWLAYLLAGFCVLPAAVSKSELSTAMPTSGGTYVYIERTFGPWAGTIAGLGLWLSLILKSSFALVGFGAYLSTFTDIPVQYAAIFLLGLIVLLNILGVGKLSKAVIFVVICVLVSLTVLSIGGLFFFEKENLEPMFKNGGYGFIEATGFVFVAFAGVDKVAAIAEEVKDPNKNLPFGILISLLIITTIYTSLSFIMAGTIESTSFQTDLRPVYTLAKLEFGSLGGYFAGVLGVLTLTSMANVGVMAASRFPFAMSRDHLLPKPFKVLNKKFLTPVFSILVTGIIIATLILFVEVDKIVKVASSFMLIIYILENITVIVLRENFVQWYQPPYKSFFYPWLQVFGIIVCFSILMFMGYIVAVAVCSAVAIGSAVYLVYGRRNTKRRGVVQIRGRRLDLIDDKPIISYNSEELFFFDKAGVVIALFGKERSPEVLLELGSVLSDDGKVEVVDLIEIPEQLALDDYSIDNSQIRSLRRRFKALSIDRNLMVEYEPLRCHDIYKTIYDVTNRLHCNWLIKEWGGNPRGTITVRNHMGWLEGHLACNLATFKDAGIRYFRRIMIFVEQGLHNPMIASTCMKIAKQYESEVVFVKWISEDLDEKRKKAESGFLRDVRDVHASSAEYLVVEGKNEIDDIVSISADFDLMIFGSQPAQNIWEMFFGTQQDKIMDQAACSVLKVQSSNF